MVSTGRIFSFIVLIRLQPLGSRDVILLLQVLSLVVTISQIYIRVTGLVPTTVHEVKCDLSKSSDSYLLEL
jgi:hypothetical protein